MTEDEELEKAKIRLEEGREDRARRRKKTSYVEEPNDLVSGNFDEVELKRIEKRGDQDD